MLHSHFTSLADQRKSIRFKSYLKNKLLFNFFPKNKYIVLGDRIKENIINAVETGGLRNRIISVFHPIGIRDFSGRLSHSDSSSPSSKIKILFLHGWHPLPDLRSNTLNALLDLSSNSKIYEVEEITNKICVGSNGKYFSVSYADRLATIASADLLLHLPSDPYTFQASGALMDSVVTNTPVIGIRTDFGMELETRIGKFGYFFDSDKELLEFMSSFDVRNAQLEINLFRENLLKSQDKLKALSLANFHSFVPSRV